MRTHSRKKVKHFPHRAREIHHLLRASCNALHRRVGAPARCHALLAGAGIACMTPLDDGTYDAFIVWAEERDDGLALEVTITSGARRGDVINIVTSDFAARDVLDLVGLACTIEVRGDEIRVRE
jgi:hypothetical protein